MNPRPDVTAVLPTRDRGRFFADALRCALGQEDVQLEVIVVDEGSTDGTPALLEEQSDPRLRVLRNDRPCGVAAARNQAVREARGTWIAFLDDDDLWAPQWLRTALDAAQGSEPTLVYGGQIVIDEARRVTGVQLPPVPESVPASLRRYNALGGPSAIVVHRDAIAAAGAFDERLSALADWEAWMRLTALRRPVAVPELLVGYTSYSDNMHRRDPFGVLAEFHRFCAIVREQHGAASVPPEPPILRWLARDMPDRWTAARLYARAARKHGPVDLARALRALVAAPSPPPPELAPPGWLAEFTAHAEPVTVGNPR